MYYKEMMITQEQAREFLAHQCVNRPIKSERLNHLICEINRGGLKTCPDPICIGVDGRLINGQHRLTAIAITGKAQKLWVAYNVPKDAVIDRGLERSLEDSLYMRGMISKQFDKKVFASMAKRYLIVATGRKGRTDEDYAVFIQKYGDKMAKAFKISQKGKHRPVAKKLGFQTALLGALIAGVPESELEQFSYIVNTGFSENQNQSSAVVLRQYLQETKMTGEVEINRLMMWTETALKDFLERKPRKNRYKDVKHYFVIGDCCNED